MCRLKPSIGNEFVVHRSAGPPQEVVGTTALPNRSSCASGGSRDASAAVGHEHRSGDERGLFRRKKEAAIGISAGSKIRFSASRSAISRNAASGVVPCAAAARAISMSLIGVLTQCMVRPCVARVFVELFDCGLASMYPASDWSVSRSRATMDISARAISLADRPRLGHLGHQCSHAPGRPILHLVLSSRRPRRVTRTIWLCHRELLILRGS